MRMGWGGGESDTRLPGDVEEMRRGVGQGKGAMGGGGGAGVMPNEYHG